MQTHDRANSLDTLNHPPGWAYLGRGADAAVWRSPDGQTVRKRYSDSDVALAAIRAEQEYEALLKANEALTAIPGVRCPIPFAIDHAAGELFMEYCAGVHLDIGLRHDRYRDSDETFRLASAIASAMGELTRALSLNQLDFSVRNTLVSSHGGEAFLIDFATRLIPDFETSDARPIEVALASFLSSTITYQLHQETLTQVTVARRMRYFARVVVAHVSSTNPIDIERTRTVAWRFYWRQSGNRGWKRFLFFNTIGPVMFRALLNRATRDLPRISSELADAETSG